MNKDNLVYEMYQSYFRWPYRFRSVTVEFYEVNLEWNMDYERFWIWIDILNVYITGTLNIALTMAAVFLSVFHHRVEQRNMMPLMDSGGWEIIYYE